MITNTEKTLILSLRQTPVFTVESVMRIVNAWNRRKAKGSRKKRSGFTAQSLKATGRMIKIYDSSLLWKKIEKFSRINTFAEAIRSLKEWPNLLELAALNNVEVIIRNIRKNSIRLTILSIVSNKKQDMILKILLLWKLNKKISIA